MNPSTLEPIDRLVAENACRNVVFEAAQLIDGAQYAELSSIFTADAQLVRPNGAELQGCEAIIESYRTRPADRLTRHLILGTFFKHVSRQAAESVTQVLLWAAHASDPPEAFGRPLRGPQVIGRFEDQFVQTASGWRISRRRASFDMYSGNV
ncbi:DUF3225 domain-containing protein [Pararobbsia alpina]|uniref:nuclear transport factor 2 family protein n=1 Tax=Pararobbsia alpina TaxID=621374 RepID=UPI0039A4C4DA